VTDLITTQRWIQGVITDHDGVQAGLARGAGETGALALEDVVRGSGALSATQRLELYSRTHRRRLAGCLRESYPGLRHALGDELFEDFALDYLRAQPSRSYTLASLGAGWPAHLEATRPDGDLPAGERERWPDFLVDLARVERTFSEVFDGTGVEGDPLATAADVPDADDPGASWETITVMPVVCLRIVAARFPVGTYLAAVRRGQDPPLPAPATSFVAVSRRDYVVTITELGAAGHALLAALVEGASVRAAAGAAGVELHEARQLVARWASRGLVAAIEGFRPAGRSFESTSGGVR
jgi:hypothetical protein